jgi:hypothetical protein
MLNLGDYPSPPILVLTDTFVKNLAVAPFTIEQGLVKIDTTQKQELDSGGKLIYRQQR